MAGWLPGHVADMRALPGFVDAQQFEPEAQDDGSVVHTVQYILQDREALDTYLLKHADPMRRAGRERFGDQMQATRSVRKLAPSDDQRCLNCGAVLSGQYCGQCGQRARRRMITVWELLRDVVDGLFDADSRLWRTLVPLLLRPGFLTAEYLYGRRVRYLPPLRTYLVLSFLFFLIAELAGGGSTVTISDDGEPAADAVAEEAEPPDCDWDLTVGVPILDRYLTEEKVEEVCEAYHRDDGKLLNERITQALPVAAMLALPILALALLILHPFTRRYLAEHLLLLVHYHAFLFLAASLLVVFNTVASWLNAPTLFYVIVNAVTGLYMIIYLYKAMRRVYGQRRLWTVPKFLALSMTYLIALVFVSVGAAIYVVISY